MWLQRECKFTWCSPTFCNRYPVIISSVNSWFSQFQYDIPEMGLGCLDTWADNLCISNSILKSLRCIIKSIFGLGLEQVLSTTVLFAH